MNEMVRFYEEYDEAGRLSEGTGLLELERSRDILKRHLPPPPARIIDVGGGPGNYAGWLAAAGYEVYLLDPVQKHLEQAARYPLAGIEHGDARALPCDNAVADAVLLMGPLYHLPERSDRLQSLREAHRSLHAGGVVCATAISRWASLLDAFAEGHIDDDDYMPVLARDLAEGLHRNDTGKPQYFTTAQFHTPGELRAELTEAGFTAIEVVAVEGPGWMTKDLASRWHEPGRRARILDLIRTVERIEPLLGSSMHLMAIGTKP
jgi:ubiquinone/menaquinone biosynthesis C-methylase UbiE